MSEPLLRWTRPLTAAERRADIDAGIANRPLDADAITALFTRFAAQQSADPENRGDVLPRHWPPVLPASVPRCRVCTLPSRHDLCAPCKRLERHLGRPLDTLEFLAIADMRDLRSPENLIWHWKETIAQGETPAEDLTSIAAGLSAYLEMHRHRLLDGGPVVTAIPTRVPVIGDALHLAATRHWFSVDIETTGWKAGEWWQHGAGQAERLSRTESDWSLLPGVVAGRPVLLFDDVFVTGASMFSYASALKRAGASEVRAVALVRHVHHTHVNYWDAWRIVRRTREWAWSPDRAAVARFSATRS